MFWSTQPATMEKRKRRTKTAAWWTFTEGKGREGQRMAICQWAPPAADENTSTMASCQNPLIPRMTWIAPPRGLLGRGTRRACREHANDTATHVELPVKKIWYSESASTRHDSVALHRRGYGMRWTVEHVPMVLRMVSRLGPGTTVDALVEP